MMDQQAQQQPKQSSSKEEVLVKPLVEITTAIEQQQQQQTPPPPLHVKPAEEKTINNNTSLHNNNNNKGAASNNNTMIANTQFKMPQGYVLVHESNAVLYRSANNVVIRCLNTQNNNQKVVMKIVTDFQAPHILYASSMSSGSTTPTMLVRAGHSPVALERDFEITTFLSKTIPSQYLLQALSKIYMDNPASMALVKEDFDAIDLNQYVISQQPNKRLPTMKFLDLAIRIAEIIAMVHKAKVLHLDIKPHNILMNTKSDIVKIADFAISQIVSLKRPYILREEGTPMGSFKFMSPEQTGRFAQVIDRRSDIYSLGMFNVI